jgi:structural maintenance of chromosome 4
VIDAMLFVFGKRAKQLRLNKVSELIHKSSQFQNRDFARVSVHFQEIIDTGDGDDDYVVLPDSERVVTRIARRDNSSTYKLDGKNCSFKDVALFLDSKGVDLDNNRFLILQGEVELISMMPPKGKTEHDEGLLEYLEDIIGSNKFVADTNLAAERVEQLTEQRQERLNRCKAVQAEKENLQGAKQEAQALLLKEREIRRKKNVLYQLHQMRLTHEVDQVLHKKGAMQERLEEERQRLTLAHDRVVELEQGLEKQRTEYEAVHAELQQTKQEFSAYERRDIKLREELKHCKTHKKKLETKIQTEADKYDSCVMAQQDANQRIPELEQEIQDLRQRKGKEDDALEAIFDEIKGVTDELRVELDHKNNELAPIAQERAVYQAKLDTATTQVKLLQDGVSRSQHQLEAAKQELASLDETQATKRNELAETEDELIACQQQVKDLELEDKALESKEASLLKRNKELLVSGLLVGQCKYS